LQAATGDWAVAAASTGDPVLAARLRARAAAAATRVSLLASDASPLAQVVRTQALLAIGQPAHAPDLTDAAVQSAPLNPEALGARRDALSALGRVAEVAQVRHALHQVDPGFDQRGTGPSTSPGSTATGAQPQPPSP